MSIHTQWIRFKRECLKGQSKEQHQVAKQLFYCGAAASADILLQRITIGRAPSAMDVRVIYGVQGELRRFQELAALNASKTKEGTE